MYISLVITEAEQGHASLDLLLAANPATFVLESVALCVLALLQLLLQPLPLLELPVLPLGLMLSERERKYTHTHTHKRSATWHTGKGFDLNKDHR